MAEAVGLGSMTLALGTVLNTLKVFHVVHNALQGGELVAVVRGANAPLLQKTILDQLEAEKEVLAGGRERRVVSRGHFYKQQTHKCAGWGASSLSCFPGTVSGKLPKCPILDLLLTEDLGRMHCTHAYYSCLHFEAF
jgi:hypothetical protein